MNTPFQYLRNRYLMRLDGLMHRRRIKNGASIQDRSTEYTWLERRICDAFDINVGNEDPTLKRFWPLTPLTRRRDIIGF